MKKIFAVLAFAVVASLAFAQYGPPPSYGRHNQPPPPRHGDGWDSASYLSVAFAVPIQWQNISDRDYSMDARTVGLGVGIDLTSFFTRHLGFHVSADLFFPQNVAYEYSGMPGRESYNPQNYWDSDWGLSVFAGPSFALLRTSRITFAVAPAFTITCSLRNEGLFRTFSGLLA